MDFSKILFADTLQCPAKIAQADDAFLECITRLRASTHARRKAVDEYVVAFFRILDSDGALFMRDYGFDTVVSEFRYLLRLCRDNPEQSFEHPIFPVMQQYIKTHPCPNESFFVEYYFVKLAPHFLSHALHSLNKECNQRMANLYAHDSLRLIEASLLAVLSKDEYDQLNSVLISRFILIPAASIFLQVLIDETCSAYLSGNDTDPELLYHIIFDEMYRNDHCAD